MKCPMCGKEGEKEKELFEPWIAQYWCEHCEEYYTYDGYEVYNGKINS